MKKYLPTNDYVFKRIFGYKGNEEIVKGLIEAITKEKFENVVIENPILQSESLSGKTGVLDVRLKADNSNVDIEIQVVKSENIQDRALWYWSKMFCESIEKGEDYSKTKRTICIVIADFNIEDLKDNDDFHTEYFPLSSNGKLLTKKMEIHIIELNKVESKENLDVKLKAWCTFIKNPEKIGDSIMSENKEIKAAKEELERINEDALEKRRAEEREKAIMDQKWWRNSAIKEGLEEGRKEGRKEVTEKIVKNMLKNEIGKEEISKLTDLTVEEIEKIENNID